jgi:hypothetical protein
MTTGEWHVNIGIGNRAAAFRSRPLFPYRKSEKERAFA